MRVIAGKARSLPLKTLPTKDVRPTTDKTKETLFNILMPLLPGCSFLDLFAGSGGIGIEALSRGAKKAVFVEQDAKACAVIKDNLHFTKLDRDAELIRGDVLRALPSLAAKGPFDIILMDPPFDHELEKEVLMRLADFPLLKEDGTIVIEASNRTDFSYVAKLPFTMVRCKSYKKHAHYFLKRKEIPNDPEGSVPGIL